MVALRSGRLKLVAQRTSDGSLLHLIRQWLDAPVVEENGKVLPNRQGVPQGEVIWPLLAHRHLNALDWAVNESTERGQPVMVHYADDAMSVAMQFMALRAGRRA